MAEQKIRIVTPEQLPGYLDAYSQQTDILNPWLRVLRQTPDIAKIALVGDSTYDSAAAGLVLHTALKAQIGPGCLLPGMVTTNVLNFGYNGATTAAITSTTNMTALTAAAPHLIIAGPGINDIRATAHTVASMRAILVTGFNKIRSACPGVPIIASIPNSFLTTDMGASGYVTPNADAQSKSSIIREAYLSLIGQWPNVLVHDTQDEVFGRTSMATSTLMGDQIHPNATGAGAKVSALLKLIGYNIPASPGLQANARSVSPLAPWTVYGREVEDLSRYVLIAEGDFVATGVGSYVDFSYSYLQSRNIMAYDLVEFPDGAVFVIPTGFSLSTPGADRTRVVSSAVVATTATGGKGKVKVWRRTTTPDSAVNGILQDAAWRYKRIGRVVTAATDSPANPAQRVLDVRAMSVTPAVPTVPAAEWLPQAGDRLYIDGLTATTGEAYFTIGTDTTAGINASDFRISAMANGVRTALLGRVAVLVGTHTASPLDVSLVQLAKSPDTLVAGTVTGDPMTSAQVQWPGGVSGTLTITERHATGAVNAYNITYGSPVTKTFTQPAITRATSGAPTNVPQIVVT